MKATTLTAACCLMLVAGVQAARTAAQRPKALKQAQKILNKLQLVDGTGSGLDADTVHGLSPTAIASLDSGGGFHVVDSVGTLVGSVTNLYSYPGVDVARREGNFLLILNVNAAGFHPGAPEALFTTPDCSGQAYRNETNRLARLASAPSETGGTVYFAGDPIEKKTMLSSSFRPETGDCGTFPQLPGGLCCCDVKDQCVGPDGYETDAGPLVEVPIATFTPPFRVEGP